MEDSHAEIPRTVELGGKMNQRRGINLGVIGLGGCGGKLAELFHRLGYPAIAVNTSSADLSSLSIPEECKLLLGPGEGSGGDIERGRELIEENGEIIRRRVSSLLEPATELLILSGTGGGTGGNLALLAERLEDLGRSISFMTVLPADFEGTQVKMNAVKAIDELTALNMGSTLMVDSATLIDRASEGGMMKLYERIDNLIVTPLDELNSISYDESLLPLYPFDPSDLRALMLQGGVMTLMRLDLLSEDISSPGRLIFRIWDKILRLAPVSGIDPTTASGCGVVLMAGEEAMSEGGERTFEILREHLAQVADGCRIYPGLYLTREEHVRLYLILSGLDLPDRIAELREQAEREWGKLQEKRGRKRELLEARPVPKAQPEVERAAALTKEELESLRILETPGGLRDSFSPLIGRIAPLDHIGENELIALKRMASSLAEMTRSSREPLLKVTEDYPEMDDFLALHSFNVALLSAYLGRGMGLSEEDVETLILAALIHDLGMFKLPRELVFAPRKLNDEEMNEIRRHPELGVEMVANTPDLPVQVPMVLIHEHERMDGSGYPEGISGDEIHQFARIVSVCDVFEAISHKRPHRDPFLPYEAMRQVIEMSRVQLDYKVVRAFVDLMSIYPIGSFVKLSTDEVAQVVDSVPGYPFHPIVRVIEVEEGQIRRKDMVYYLKDETGVKIVGPTDPLRPRIS